MLSRKNRFHGHQAVRRVYRQGRAVRGSAISLHVHTDERLQVSKTAVVVSKKVDKSAVRRNRIRRRVYEIVRAQQPEFKQPAALVFTVYSADIATMPSEQLAKTIKELLVTGRVLTAA
jgi:ribonuclease P protein component